MCHILPGIILLFVFANWRSSVIIVGCISERSTAETSEKTTEFTSKAFRTKDTTDKSTRQTHGFSRRDWIKGGNITDDNLSERDLSEILKAFTLKDQRDIVHEQIRYCGVALTCLNYSSSGRFCCDNCSCDDGCEEDLSCCPDKLSEDVVKLSADELSIITRSSTECVPTRLATRHQLYIGLGANVVNKCPSDSQTSIVEKCKKEYFDGRFSLGDVIPVTDITTMTTYRNKHCAICNKLRDSSVLKVWRPLLYCMDGYFVSASSEQDLIRTVQENDTCYIEFERPFSDGDIGHCVLMVTKCNVTGAFMTKNILHERACAMYESYIKIEFPFGFVVFRNTFCALCNGITYNDLQCYHNPEFRDPYSFSTLLSLEDDDYGSIPRGNCEDNFIFDEITVSIFSRVIGAADYIFRHSFYFEITCRKLYCSSVRVMRNGRCDKTFDNLDLMYDFTARVYLDDDNNTTLDDALEQSGFVIDWFVRFVGNLSNTLKSKKSFANLVTVCHVQLLLKSAANYNNITYENQTTLFRERLSHYDIRIEFMVSNLHDPESVRAYMIQVDNKEVDGTSENPSFRYRVQTRDVAYIFEAVSNSSSRYIHYLGEGNTSLNILDDISEGVFIRLNSDEKGFNFSNCSAEKPLIKLIALQSCPMVEISKSDWPWVEHENGIQFERSDHVIPFVSYFYVSNNIDQVAMCAKEFFHSRADRITDGIVSLETIISLVSISVSMLCLCITFTFFTRTLQFRSLPGKNNMALVFSLFLAQLFYIVSSFGNVSEDATLCRVIGLLTHLFWLLALFWMNSCTIHMFRVFRKVRLVSTDAGWKTHVIYHVYSICSSVLFVVLHVIVSMVMSDGKSLGYGTRICYISSRRMVEYFFGIPVGCVVLSNIGMFIFVVYSIRKTSSVHQASGGHRNDIVIFTKLSTITGMSWMFGFAYHWTRLTAFSYISIVMNAGQGVFIALAFVFNANTFKKLKCNMKNHSPTSTTTLKSENTSAYSEERL